VCLLMLLTKRITAHEDFAFQSLSLLSSILNAQGGVSWPPKTVPLFVDQGSYEECHGNGIRMRIR
jgi:hypothetical protein